jgi:purine-nucleoside phosphorylase
MSIHIEAKNGEIASTILMPGDPLRAKFFAEKLLQDPIRFNDVRGMLGYSGRYKGKFVSFMGSGMGIPTLMIYAHELFADYGVQTIIRVGTCGAMIEELKIGQQILAMSASTDSHINKLRFNGQDYAPTANFELLLSAYNVARSRAIDVKVGNVLSSDTFYHDNDEYWKKWARFGALVVEMETAGLYTMAAKFNARALSILTVSDNLITHEAAPSEIREKGYITMAEIALEAAL